MLSWDLQDGSTPSCSVAKTCICVWSSGAAGRGKCWTQHNSGGHKGAEIEFKRTWTDAVPGGSSALPVGKKKSHSVHSFIVKLTGLILTCVCVCLGECYRTLQHPALLQCLAQCTDVTPYLLIMEYCPLVI